jgi:hypothetical protein
MVSIVMGLDQHRAQIIGEWIDTETGEVQRTRVAPADRAAVRKFLQRFRGRRLEVALEATTGWRFVVEELRRVGAGVHLAEPAETADLVNRYLAGVATERVTNLNVDPYSITGIRRSGRLNAAPPTAQRFWVAQASSTRTAAQINWKIRDGQYRAVVMNANGHGGFASTSAIGITIPNIAVYAVAGLLLGLLVAGGGTALLIRATRQPRTSANGSSPRSSAAAAPTL